VIVAKEPLARIMRDALCRFILDVRGEPLLRCLPTAPFLVKPNREELLATLDRTPASAM
jgi:fructose-1-phosphate kinase PfkB-like protein